MAQALYRKWRPSNWGDVVGQTHVIESLRNAVAAERVGHAYLFAGPRGTGKTSVARLLAKALDCQHEDAAKRPDDSCEHCQAINAGSFLDLIEIDAASNTSVEDVRELRDKINFSPNHGRYKVYIIDEVHMLSTAAFNALLKTLEEPPPHAIFVLATTEVHKIPATVLSRCQRHEFRRLPNAEIIAHLKKIASEEKITAEEDALALIARQATGSMRDAISLLDQLSSLGERVTLQWAQEVLGAATSQVVLDLVDAILAGNSAAGLDNIHSALDAGSDPRQLARQIVEYLRAVLLQRMGAEQGAEMSAEERQHLARHAQDFPVPNILRTIRLFSQAANEAKAAWQSSLPLEMAFVDALEPSDESASQPPKSEPNEKKQSMQAAKSDKQKTAAPAKASPTPSLENAQWAQIKEEVKALSPNTHALLNSSKTRELRGKQLFLGFASDLLKEKMAQDDHLELLQAALEKVLGQRLAVECFVSTGKSGELPEGLDSSSMVAAAMRLGGEIVDENDLGKAAESSS
jgi:DNA polymerase-3 subunit gamma/tau